MEIRIRRIKFRGRVEMIDWEKEKQKEDEEFDKLIAETNQMCDEVEEMLKNDIN